MEQGGEGALTAYRGIYQCRLCKQRVHTSYAFFCDKRNGFAVFESYPLYMEHECKPEEGCTLHGLCDLIGAEEIDDGEQR